MAPSEDLAVYVEHEMAVARGRFRSRIAILAGASVVLDLVAAGLAKVFEQGAQHSFATYLDALFWTTTQLLTVSSQLQNPDSTAAHILDVVMQVLAISIVTSIAGSWAAFFHHRRHPRPAAPSAENGPSPSGASEQP
jgi:hypothetical protein